MPTPNAHTNDATSDAIRRRNVLYGFACLGANATYLIAMAGAHLARMPYVMLVLTAVLCGFCCVKLMQDESGVGGASGIQSFLSSYIKEQRPWQQALLAGVIVTSMSALALMSANSLTPMGTSIAEGVRMGSLCLMVISVMRYTTKGKWILVTTWVVTDLIAFAAILKDVETNPFSVFLIGTISGWVGLMMLSWFERKWKRTK